MAEKKRTSEPTAQNDSAKMPKKSYEPPKVVSHHQMEVIASTCAAPAGKQTILVDGCSVAMS
jgi:hypothetical protein